MKSVCICGSFRFYDEMVALRDALHARRKPLYILAPIPDPFLMALVTVVVSIEDLLQLIQA